MQVVRKIAMNLALIVAALTLTTALLFGIRSLTNNSERQDIQQSFQTICELVADGATAGFFLWTELYELAESGQVQAVQEWLDTIPSEIRFVKSANIVHSAPPSEHYVFSVDKNELIAAFPFKDSSGQRSLAGTSSRLTIDAAAILEAAQSRQQFALADTGMDFPYGLKVRQLTGYFRPEDLAAILLLSSLLYGIVSVFRHRSTRFFLEAKGLDSIIYLFENAESYSAHHSRRVANLCVDLGKAFGLRGKRLRNLHAAAMLHDIGKIAINPDILTKPSELSETEYNIIKTHPDHSFRILSYFKELAHLAPLARGHHEKLDGSGYPDGLTGEELNLELRILSVADIYEALTGRRPYRQAFAAADALEHLRTMPLDQNIVAGLEQLIRQDTLSTRPPQ